MSALMSRLLRDGVIDAALTEEVIVRQVEAGGPLDTALLELEACDENELLSHYAEVEGLYPATRRELMRVPLSTLQSVTRQVADTHRVIPMRISEATICLAFGAAPPPQVLQHLEAELGRSVDAHITLDIGISEALERYYGVRLSDREELLLAALNRRPRGEMTLQSRREVISRERSETPRYGFQVTETERQRLEDAWGTARGRNLTASTRTIQRADSVTEVFEAVLAGLRQEFERAAFFTVRGGEAVGHIVGGLEGSPQRIERLVYPLTVPSFLARAIGSLRAVRVDPDGGLDRLVLSDLGIREPEGAWCFPFAEAGQVQAIVVVAGGPLAGDPGALDSLGTLGRPTARALMRLGTWGKKEVARARETESARQTLQSAEPSSLDPRRAGEPISWPRRGTQEEVEEVPRTSLIPAEYQDAAVLRTPTQMRAGGVRVLRDAHTEPPAAGQRAALIDEGVDGLVMSLLTQKPGEADEIIAKLRPLGDVAIHVLGERFPGPLWWNPESGVVPNGAGISAVSYALSEFGAAAFYAMRHHLESSDPVNRLCALAWAGYVLEDDELIPWLGRRIFDVDQSVRDVALELLCRRSECGAEYEASLSAIRATARVHRPQSDLRAVAIRALGQLRDVQALGLLIDLLGDLEPAIAQSAHSALVMISGNDFGSVPREWWRWTDNHGSEPRIQWLIAGLDAEREATRQHAAQEIERLTNHYVGYHPALPPEERLRCQNDYRSWWESHGDSSA